LLPEIPPPKTSGKNLESESTLQVVILADSFNERFRPIILDRPRVVKEASPFHKTRSLGESPIFVLDEKTNECVHCEPWSSIRVNVAWLWIDICSVKVPAFIHREF
ncbi:687_t:CDS:2, partial [Cetraspora pellucida]